MPLYGNNGETYEFKQPIETIEIVSSGYEWECPACNYTNNSDSAPDEGTLVQCDICKSVYEVSGIVHIHQ